MVRIENIAAIIAIQYDMSWGIWAELIDGQILPESEARYGQNISKNGGVQDGKILVCDSEVAEDHLAEWQDEDGHLIAGWVEALIDQINQSLTSEEVE